MEYVKRDVAKTGKWYVDGASYSTDEVDTGLTWIDGKKLYQKSFDISEITSSYTNLVDITDLGIDTVVALNPIAKGTVSSYIGNFYESSSRYLDVFVTMADEHRVIRGRLQLPNGELVSAVVTIVYTKE